MLTSIIIIIIISCLLFKCECNNNDYFVEHNFFSSDWSLRGRLLIDKTSRSGSLSIHDWTDDEIEKWNDDKNNLFYKLRIKINENNYLTSSVLKCQLLNRGEERIILHSDDNGNLIGFDYYTTNSFCNNNNLKKNKNKNKIPKSLEKSVQVSMSFGDKGDSPYLAEYEISPPKKEQTSFWSKYWWVILIVGFVLLQSVAASAAG